MKKKRDIISRWIQETRTGEEAERLGAGDYREDRSTLRQVGLYLAEEYRDYRKRFPDWPIVGREHFVRWAKRYTPASARWVY